MTAPAVVDPEEFGFLRGSVEGMKESMSEMQTNIADLTTDVHEIKETVAAMKPQLDLLTKRGGPGTGMLVAGLIVFAGAGLYRGLIGQWLAALIILVAAALHQHEKVTRIAEVVFRTNMNRRTTDVKTVPDDQEEASK